MDKEQQFTIELLGDGRIEIATGQTILAASLAAGIAHYHACGGKGQCSTCWVLVHEGAAHLFAESEKESNLRRRIHFPASVRLACQTYVVGENVKVHRMIRDETDVGFYINGNVLANTAYTAEEKELALFFLDIRNFTLFVETYLPFDVIHILRRLFALFRAVVESNNGHIIETAGDGFYAVFGFDTTIDKAVDNACKAGCQIVQDLEAFNNNYMQKNFRHSFQVGMGLHTGKVITGHIGIGVNNNITVTGLPVNIAARLQAATKEWNNNFLISGTAFEKLDKKPKAAKATVWVKGVKEALLVYLVGVPYASG